MSHTFALWCFNHFRQDGELTHLKYIYHIIIYINLIFMIAIMLLDAQLEAQLFAHLAILAKKDSKRTIYRWAKRWGWKEHKGSMMGYFLQKDHPEMKRVRDAVHLRLLASEGVRAGNSKCIAQSNK